VSIGNMHPIQAKETGGTTPERKKNGIPTRIPDLVYAFQMICIMET